MLFHTPNPIVHWLHWAPSAPHIPNLITTTNCPRLREPPCPEEEEEEEGWDVNVVERRGTIKKCAEKCRGFFCIGRVGRQVEYRTSPIKKNFEQSIPPIRYPAGWAGHKGGPGAGHLVPTPNTAICLPMLNLNTIKFSAPHTRAYTTGQLTRWYFDWIHHLHHPTWNPFEVSQSVFQHEMGRREKDRICKKVSDGALYLYIVVAIMNPTGNKRNHVWYKWIQVKIGWPNKTQLINRSIAGQPTKPTIYPYNTNKLYFQIT